MNIKESILIAIDSIKVNKLRSSLTLLSIAIGVFAIIVSIALVQSIDKTLNKQLELLGTNTFLIYKMPAIRFGPHSWNKYNKRKPINYSLYKKFKSNMKTAEAISCASQSQGISIKYKNNETNPNVTLIGCDADYFVTSYTVLSEGRLFLTENDNNSNFALIGSETASILFGSESPIGKSITIKKQRFVVIGVLAPLGQLFGQSRDNIVYIPITRFLKYYANPWEETLSIMVKAYNKKILNYTMDEAYGVMRSLRNQHPWELNSFELETNESLQDQFKSFTIYLSVFGLVTGFIALIAAGVGIMNIMLVTIKERTREIGIRKAIGAKKRWILTQFLIETITISQIGGIIGIGSGFLLASLFGSLMGLNIAFPFDWVLIVVLICTVIGVGFGLYPAIKAANLDPIEALRYE